VIHVDGLVRKYGATVAVAGLSFDIPPGEVVGFLGPNGAGKTTTFKVLAGFLDPTAGEVTLDGKSVVEDSLACRARVGYLPENNPLYEEMRVFEYLGWTAGLRGLRGERRGQALRRAVERCGLGSVVGKEIGALSKGFRQRVGLAQAILHDPQILLLDEPTSGLDPNQADSVRALIAELRRDKTVLLSSHILSEVRASCDRVIIIHQGRIAAQGRPDELARGAERGTRLSVFLRGGPDPEVEERLRGLTGLRSLAARERDGETEYALTCGEEGGDPRGRVFSLAAKARWPLLELKRESASLEDVFRSLTA
jgi:gliding motility-associated transport system ATP-binding protein